MVDRRQIRGAGSSCSGNRLMDRNITPTLSLPEEAKAIIWRIFGSGESPLKKKSTYDLIEPVVRKHISSTDANWIINEIRGWFESHGDRSWLKPEMIKPVASLILEGIGTQRDEIAIWAIASIETDLAARIIGSLWSSEEIGSFVECALATLENLCDRDEVLDATRIMTFDSNRTKIPKDAVQREGILETFRQLDTNGSELVYQGLHRAAANLIELMIELHPDQFKSLIERLDHPVMQAWAACRILAVDRPLDHRKTLLWITEDSCDDLVALAIVHTLNTVNGLDEDLRFVDHMSRDHIWRTELRPPEDDLDSAAVNLLTDLVDRLAMLKPLACARWIGELLSSAPYVLHRSGDREIPPLINRLERACTELVARLVRQSWTDDLLPEFSAGLCLTPRKTWTRHLAEIAWEIRDVEPARAVEIARVTLDKHAQQIAEELERSHLFLNWSDWHDREWFHGLGVALALSREELDLPSWVRAQCRALPLSVWDAEEDYQAFMTADRAVQHWFLVALHAITPMKELGCTVDPAAVRALVEILWAHCRFAGQFLHSHSEDSVVAEHAARSAIEFGEPSGAWLLNQARDPGVGPRALWALLHQRKIQNTREYRTDTCHDKMITIEFARVASDRFRNERQFNLETLRFWGWLWLLVSAIDEAEQTAMAIIRFPLRADNRADKILALKLFALVASTRKAAPEVTDYLASLYDQLWHGYTPSEERGDRREINELLGQSDIRIF